MDGRSFSLCSFEAVSQMLGQSVLGTEKLLRLLSLRVLFRSKPLFGTSHLTATSENFNFSSLPLSFPVTAQLDLFFSTDHRRTQHDLLSLKIQPDCCCSHFSGGLLTPVSISTYLVPVLHPPELPINLLSSETWKDTKGIQKPCAAVCWFCMLSCRAGPVTLQHHENAISIHKSSLLTCLQFSIGISGNFGEIWMI